MCLSIFFLSIKLSNEGLSWNDRVTEKGEMTSRQKLNEGLVSHYYIVRGQGDKNHKLKAPLILLLQSCFHSHQKCFCFYMLSKFKIRLLNDFQSPIF